MGDDHSSDWFRINEYKIRMCPWAHNMRDCPWAHPDDPARRRDHNRHHYSFERCPDFSNGGGCPNGDACSLAHGDYEVWFHPQYYRVHPCLFAPNCTIRFCPFVHTDEEDRSRLILNQPATVPHHNSVLQGSSSSAAAYSNQRPRLADHSSVLRGSSSSVACSNQQPRFGNNFAQGSFSSVVYSNLQPRISYDSEFPPFQSTQPPPPMMQPPNSKTPSRPPPPPPMMQPPNSQTPSRPPSPSPMMQPPNSQTRVIVRREERPQSSQFGTRPPRHGLGPIARPPRTNIGVQQQPQSVLAPFPTDLSRPFPRLQADAASLEEARSKRKHDHEAGSSNN